MIQKSFLVVGLGNPGTTYTYTRHNLGFLAIDACLTHYNTSELLASTSSDKPPKQKLKKKYHSEIWETTLVHHKILLAKPQTFMNKSGQAVLSIMSAYKLHPSQLLIVYDDASLPFGKLKVKYTGSSGGHNGLASIIAQIGKDFMRLKCGIGYSIHSADKKKAFTPTLPLEQYVLNTFNHEERNALPAYCETLAQVVHALIQPNHTAAMTHISGKHFEEINCNLLK